jgi:hypothetical protein
MPQSGFAGCGCGCGGGEFHRAVPAGYAIRRLAVVAGLEAAIPDAAAPRDRLLADRF